MPNYLAFIPDFFAKMPELYLNCPFSQSAYMPDSPAYMPESFAHVPECQTPLPIDGNMDENVCSKWMKVWNYLLAKIYKRLYMSVCYRIESFSWSPKKMIGLYECKGL